MRQWATLAFAQDEHGVVRIEIYTKTPLEDRRNWSRVLDEATGEQTVVERVFTPAQYLPQRGAIEFLSLGRRDRPWRYLEVRAAGGVWRMFDLSEGSEERRLLEVLASQEWVEAVWVNEGVRALHEIDPRARASWRAGFEETRGVSAAQWREEIEEWKWRTRPGWSGEPRPRRYKRRTMPAPTSRRSRSLRHAQARSRATGRS